MTMRRCDRPKHPRMEACERSTRAGPACPGQQAALSDAAHVVRISLFFFLVDWWPERAALLPGCYGGKLPPVNLLGWAAAAARADAVNWTCVCVCVCVLRGCLSVCLAAQMARDS